jgi:hypothetical protein
LNSVFDMIGFIYPDYCYPSRKQGKKRKTAASAISDVPKGKKIKVLTHRLRYIETTILPKLSERTYFAAEAEQFAPASQSAEESATVPVETPKNGAEAKEEAAKKPELDKAIVLLEILSPSAEAELPKVAKAPATTPKRRRMASMPDAVMETTKALTPTPVKKVVETVMARAETEAGPSVPAEAEPAATEQRAEQEFPDTNMSARRMWPKKLNLLLSKHRPKILTLLVDMLRERDYLKKKLQKPNTMPGN